jgi:hypothetical protein
MPDTGKPVSRFEVEAALRPIEPNYRALAKLGLTIVPTLDQLIKSGDPLIAPRAVWAAAALAAETKDENEVGAITNLIDHSSRSKDVVVRVAAAGATHALPSQAGGRISARLLGDRDVGVRKSALEGVPTALSPALVAKLEQVAAHDKVPELRAMATTLLEHHPKADAPQR